MPLSDGDTFAGYTVHRLIGTGETGEVYLAKHPALPRLDALRILPASASVDDGYRARFARAAELAAGLSNPHIVGGHEHGFEDGRLWIATDYVDGIDAQKLLAGDYPAGMPINLVIDIVAALAQALDFAHDHDVVHGDVKPANTLLVAHNSSRKRRILLADFGIARRHDDAASDARADQYALAATTFTLLTNKPYRSSKPERLADTHTSLAHLDDILDKALSATPDDRYPRCGDFSDALTAAHTSVTTALDTTADVVSNGPRRWTKKKTTIAVLATVGIIATLSTVVAGVFAAFVGFTQQAPSPQESNAAQPISTTTTVPPAPIAPLTVRPVVVGYVPTPEQCLAPPPPVPPTEVLITCDLEKTGVYTLDPTVLELTLTRVESMMMPNKSEAVQIGLDDASRAAFADYTSKNIGGEIAFVRDGVVVWLASIGSPIDGPALQLAGDLTPEQVKQMVTMLRDGR